MFNKFLQWSNQLWVIGRHSNVAYLRLFPNPGFMIPWFGDKRLRWSKFYGLQVTKAPTPGNPRGL